MLFTVTGTTVGDRDRFLADLAGAAKRSCLEVRPVGTGRPDIQRRGKGDPARRIPRNIDKQLRAHADPVKFRIPCRECSNQQVSADASLSLEHVNRIRPLRV